MAKSKELNMKIPSVGDLFSTQEEREEDGTYEMVAGHRRRMASELAEKENMVWIPLGLKNMQKSSCLNCFA